MANAEIAQETAHKKKKTRSPSYPVFGLEEAIQRANTVYESEDQHWAPPDAIASHLNFTATSSSFLTALSALKQFGLMEDQGTGDRRKLRISDLAVDLIERDHASAEWQAAAKDAALRPRIHAELWGRYSGNLPPKDESIRIYLIRERTEGTFNKDHVGSFIEQFRATIAYAGLIPDDKIPNETTDVPESGSGTSAQKSQLDDFAGMFSNIFPKPTPKPMTAVQTPPAETKREVFTLAEGDVLVQWPAHLSAESVEDLEDHLNLILRKVKRSVSSHATPEDE